MMKLRVRSEVNPSKNIIFPLALFRFVVKSLLGWISLFSIGFNDKRRAIHDYAGMSVVIEVE